MNVIARVRTAPANLATAVRRDIQHVDADLPIGGPFPLAEQLDQGFSYRFNRSMAARFVSFAAIALLLASAGLDAVVAQAVSGRTREIGIRIAIGATTPDILTPVLTQVCVRCAPVSRSASPEHWRSCRCCGRLSSRSRRPIR
jgi:hypothetical protein